MVARRRPKAERSDFLLVTFVVVAVMPFNISGKTAFLNLYCFIDFIKLNRRAFYGKLYSAARSYAPRINGFFGYMVNVWLVPISISYTSKDITRLHDQPV